MRASGSSAHSRRIIAHDHGALSDPLRLPLSSSLHTYIFLWQCKRAYDDPARGGDKYRSGRQAIDARRCGVCGWRMAQGWPGMETDIRIEMRALAPFRTLLLYSSSFCAESGRECATCKARAGC